MSKHAWKSVLRFSTEIHSKIRCNKVLEYLLLGDKLLW